jgi:GTP pyrophosphokinase
MSFALQRHWHQPRKGTAIPYMAHLLQVCGIVLEAGGDEDQAIAALLHDAIEDAPAGQADWVRRQIRGRFGGRVLGIVEACTDADTQPKPPWRERKERYVERLRSVPSDALLVASADKLHNARATLRDLRDVGEAVWDRFAGGREGTLWYYRAVVDALRRAGGTPLLSELETTLSAIEAEAGTA